MVNNQQSPGLIDEKMFAIYDLYFSWNLRPKDVCRLCPWWAKLFGDTIDDGSINSILQTILLGRRLQLLADGKLVFVQDPSITSKQVIKFVLKHQFNSIWGRIKYILAGVLYIVLGIVDCV